MVIIKDTSCFLNWVVGIWGVHFIYTFYYYSYIDIFTFVYIHIYDKKLKA